jgi:hypothetical protein
MMVYVRVSLMLGTTWRSRSVTYDDRTITVPVDLEGTSVKGTVAKVGGRLTCTRVTVNNKEDERPALGASVSVTKPRKEKTRLSL